MGAIVSGVSALAVFVWSLVRGVVLAVWSAVFDFAATAPVLAQLVLWAVLWLVVWGVFVRPDRRAPRSNSF